MLSSRIEKIRDRIRNTTPTICLDRARIATEFYKIPSVEPYVSRRAKLFDLILKTREIYIEEDSFLAGSIASRTRAVPVFPEMTNWLPEAVETFDTRQFDPFQYMPGEKEELREIAKSWQGHTFGDYTDEIMTEEEHELVKSGIFTRGIQQCSTMCHAPDYANLVKRGYRYYIDKCKEEISKLNDGMTIENTDQRLKWEAMITAMEGVIKLAHRYAELAESKAASCENPDQKKMYETIATNCRIVPENPPQNFLQAAQLVLLTHDALMIENMGYIHALGRFDQYMYDFYKKDLESGVSEEEICDVIHEFKLRIEEMWYLRDEYESAAYPGCALYIQMTLGGQKRDGSDACNELTRLILHGMEDLQTKEPPVSFRYHDNVDEETFRLAIKVALTGGSHPAFFNDNNSIPALKKLGFTEEQARDWCLLGCTEPIVPGVSDYQSMLGFFNLIKVFEITLYGGKDPVTGKQIGPKTGNTREFTSISQLKEAYLTQLSYFIKRFVGKFNRLVSIHAYTMPTLISSAFTQGCIEKGKLLQDKGADYRWDAMAITGLANIADSFAAIEECVFNKNHITMTELMELLETDFKDKENLRQMLIHRAPKYGNDIEQVDKYAKFVAESADAEIKKYKDGRDGTFISVCATQSYNVQLGKNITATPDGRHAYTPLADNASPMIGCDTCGPTAVVKSVDSIDQGAMQAGMLLNQRFDPQIVKGEKGIDILETVLKAHFSMKGSHMQVNVVDNETFRDAQKHPEKYRNMLVRVAGYSAFFVDLEENIQENIIERTIQTSI
ncbi:pyruvate formate lyase family protein [Wukongibacter baidiensis]|uniref:glycyl radical protein n=1 Tax=Wukongibacter baidiensis TaxID=1723361 RepID=UPI003D7FEB71